MHAAIGAAREMHLHDAVRRHGLDISRHVEAVIGGADIDVIDVEQEAAAGLLRQQAQILPFRNI
jgi:DNA-directed RNA polymerase specialized sigma24 family protein